MCRLYKLKAKIIDKFDSETDAFRQLLADPDVQKIVERIKVEMESGLPTKFDRCATARELAHIQHGYQLSTHKMVRGVLGVIKSNLSLSLEEVQVIITTLISKDCQVDTKTGFIEDAVLIEWLEAADRLCRETKPKDRMCMVIRVTLTSAMQRVRSTHREVCKIFNP